MGHFVTLHERLKYSGVSLVVYRFIGHGLSVAVDNLMKTSTSTCALRSTSNSAVRILFLGVPRGDVDSDPDAFPCFVSPWQAFSFLYWVVRTCVGAYGERNPEASAIVPERRYIIVSPVLVGRVFDAFRV